MLMKKKKGRGLFVGSDGFPAAQAPNGVHLLISLIQQTLSGNSTRRRRSATQPPFAWRFCGDMKRDETTRMHKRKWEENERDEERKKCCNGARDASPLTIENLLKYSDFMHSK
ncbi:hypothetical protein OUZ56_008942 [Daphnia magna]|uniref:Uncharacterized protein n=1 Tax=Daphnia magna TaxID=35525 RepID=A0ABR0AEJ0_9CRUS|nr:hypothetical protein OUZ56_008942 [Daphnia magna]